MAEVAAIWAIVTNSINAINTVKGWIQELRRLQKQVQHLEQKLDELMLKYQSSQATLEAWAEMWEINENTNKNYPRGLWGKTASEVIENHLKSISNRHQNIQELLGLTSKEKPINPEESADSKTGFSRLFKKKKTSKGNCLSSLDMVMNKVPNVLDEFESIKTLMATVKELSEEAFKHKHQKVMLSEQSRKTLTQARNTMFLNAVYNSRIPCKAFYDSCYDAKKRFKSSDVHLEMDIYPQDLDPNNPRTVYELQYFLYFQVHTNIEEYTVAGPLSEDAVSGPNSSNLYTACMKTRNSFTRQLFKVGETWFGSTVPRDSDRVIPREPDARKDKLKPLESILYDLSTKIADQPVVKFPLSERIRFAFKIAQWGFFLCGTSWMVNLRLRNIRSIRDSTSMRHFLLETPASQIVLADARNERKEHNRQFAEHAFSIGILLLEIGTGRELERVGNDKHTGFTFFFCLPGMTKAPTAKPKTIIEISGILKEAFGDEYVKAVKTCLHCKDSWIWDANKESLNPEDLYNQMLDEYYVDVYLP
ncbi:hypothetical protein N7471_010700 [Penicillium samsonianum]|uniref:uncharacterized protein n=1 Tax=Penicillium samsonianum TaxID=1882272 RepID=UPI0025495338|nr:uncharacterized protein N7471_010700 [Penicillium samsonianum]KAJ6126207.1 hypothetical protein N7471_010700 [Penicillium samsonianum]